MSDWLLAGFAWLSGAGCMWLWMDLRTYHRCSCGGHRLDPPRRTVVRDAWGIHGPSICAHISEDWSR